MQRSTRREGATSRQTYGAPGASQAGPAASYDEPLVRSTDIGGRLDEAPGLCVSVASSASDLNRAERNNGGPAPKGVRESNIVRLEAVGREESLKAWGLNASARWSEAERRPRHSDELDGHEHDAEAVDGDRELEELGFLLDGGWTAVDSTRGSRGWTPGARDAGMTSHRGVLHPDEHVDVEALRAAVEAELGFTYDDVRSVYRRGRLSSSTLELRARIDGRILELSDTGANIVQLGRVLGFSVNASGSCEALNNALERARQERSATP